MATRNWLFRREIPINDWIRVAIPTVGEVLEQEDAYYGMVSLLTAMPIDMMVQLDDAGIDFAAINEWELFQILFRTLRETDAAAARLVFSGLDLRAFEPAVSTQNGQLIFADRRTGARIDRAIHARIANALRKINHLEKNLRRPGNGEAKAYMLRRAREKLARQKNRARDSQLEELIVSLVNTEQFPYGFEETRELTVYQFNESVRQVLRKIDYDNRMRGVYAGTIDTKKLSRDDLTWLTHQS